MILENRQFVDQRREVIDEFIRRHADALAVQGSVVATYRRRGDRRLGPYFKLTCRSAGRQVAVYVGDEEVLVTYVRERLATLQHFKRERRRSNKIRRVVRRHARANRLAMEAEFAKPGLYRKGHEIRGWRSASARAAMSASLLSSTPTK